MIKKRFYNGVRSPRKTSYNKYNSRYIVVQNRSYTEAELAYRMQSGLPLPELTQYNVYSQSPVQEPRDYIEAFDMIRRLDANNFQKVELQKQLNNVPKSEVPTQPDTKEDKGNG